ncbi:MAG: glycoside hydrolase family 3 N-terminal domain-containing protein [Candidatus Limnocylindrales bacterium]
MIASQLMIAFAGYALPADVASALADRPFAGVTLFREHNVASAAQVRVLTEAMQAAASAGSRPDVPLLIAADQETGQLVGLGDDTTQFAGAMALGAAGSEELAESVARATAREMRALGVNVNYAPVCDLATNPYNPGLGIRCFGDDPAAVGALAAATVRGLQAEGVAACVKHFPGAGDAGADTHHELAVIGVSHGEFEGRELTPFRMAIAAGARLAMAGHFSVPSVTGDPSLPASLARGVITDILRGDLGFEGLAITDALDMRALAQGAAQVVDVIAAVRAGQDLLLGTADADLIQRLEDGLEQAAKRGLTDASAREASSRRLGAVRNWLTGFEPLPLEIVGCAEHRALADELAQASITLVRNDEGLLPLRPAGDARVLVIQPRPTDLTPADTSSRVPPLLAEAVRRRHSSTEELLVELEPSDAEVAALAQRAATYDVVLLGTVSANLVAGQGALAEAVLKAAPGRVVTVALRTPWDIASYPQAQTHVCSYGILGPTMNALAAALFGDIPFRGRLPVEIRGLHPRGHGLTAQGLGRG